MPAAEGPDVHIDGAVALVGMALGDDGRDVVDDRVVGALAGHLLEVLGDAREGVGHADVERRQVFDELGLVPARVRVEDGVVGHGLAERRVECLA